MKGNNKFMNRTTILVILGIIVVAGGVFGYRYYNIGPNSEARYELATVQKGTLIQEVSASGEVAPSETIELQFKNSGKMNVLKAKVGKEVKAGELLAKQDTSQLDAQLAEMEAGINVQKARLDQLLAGASLEEIKVYETAMENAKIEIENVQVALKNVERDLSDAKADAQNDLDKAYGDAQNYLDDAYLKSYNAFNTVDLIQRTYFNINDQVGIKVKENKDIIGNALIKIKSSIETAKKTNAKEDTDAALSETKEALEEISLSLKTIREVCEEPIYRSAVSSTDKTSLDNHRSNIITALTNVVNSQQTISTTKLANKININTAQSRVDSSKNSLKTTEGNLKSAQDQLAQIKAPPREKDVALYQAQLNQAEASMEQVKARIEELVIASPTDGVVTEVNGNVGETINAGLVVVKIIPAGALQVDVDISELDIIKIKLGQEVRITLDAFGDEAPWLGKVVAIYPSETVVGGAIYYKTTMLFDREDDRIKPGMTADVWIKTIQKDNALFVSLVAVKEKNNKKYVEFLEGNKVKQKEIKTGSKGTGGTVEILSGLSEGEKIIVSTK